MKSKVKILETCTLPVLTYGAQTSALTKAQLNKLRVTHRSVERNILDIRQREKIKNEKIRNTTGSKDAGYIIKKANLDMRDVW